MENGGSPGSHHVSVDAGEWQMQGLVPDLEGQRVIKYRNVLNSGFSDSSR